jgi:hypothetical protein
MHKDVRFIRPWTVGRILVILSIQEFIHPGSMLRECEYLSAKNMDHSVDPEIQNGDFVANVSIFTIL